MSRRTVFPPFGKLGFGKLRASVPLFFTLTMFLSCSAARTASAQDGRTILQNMINTYRGLSSYEGRSTATLSQANLQGKIISVSAFTTMLLYQRPNKLKLDFTSPQGGNTVYCDGSTLAFIQGRLQTYSVTHVNSKNLRELSTELLKLQISGRFDTLYFLSGNSLPQSVTNIKRKADDVRGNRPVFVVTAREKTPTAVITWTWMIDKQTNALARIVGRTTNPPGTLKFVRSGKIGANRVPMDSVLAQNIISPMLNGNLDSGVFVFRPPADLQQVPFTTAVQQQQQRFSGSTSAPAGTGK